MPSNVRSQWADFTFLEAQKADTLLAAVGAFTHMETFLTRILQDQSTSDEEILRDADFAGWTFEPTTTLATTASDWSRRRLAEAAKDNDVSRLMTRWQASGLPERRGHLIDYIGFVSRVFFDPVERVRQQINKIGQLPADWDSYGATAPSARAIHNAERVLDILALLKVEPSAAEATSDESIIIEGALNDFRIVTEVDEEEDDVGVSLKKEGTQALYADVALADLQRFLTTRLNGAG